MPKFSIELGDKIRALRRQAGLTQEGLANESGISRIAISMIEIGRQRPSPGLVARLARALNVSPQVLTNTQLDVLHPNEATSSSKRTRPLLERQRIEPVRQRLTLDISPDVESALNELSKEQSTSRAEVMRAALQSYLENVGYESRFIHEDVDGQKFTRRIQVRNVKQVMFHSNLLIRAFEETLEYDPQRHHNQPPPALRLEDKDYLEELRKLVSELKQMNAFLAELTARKKAKDKPPIQLGKHLNTFLNRYAATLGHGAGVMTLGVIATLLYQLGAGEVVFDHVLKNILRR